MELNSTNTQVLVETRTKDGAWPSAGNVKVDFAGPARLDVMLVADSSGSEAAHLALMQSSIDDFAKKLMAGRSGDRFGLVRVSTEAELLLGPNDDVNRLHAASSEMFITNGWTALWDGIRLANETLSATPLAEATNRGKNTLVPPQPTTRRRSASPRRDVPAPLQARR